MPGYKYSPHDAAVVLSGQTGINLYIKCIFICCCPIPKSFTIYNFILDKVDKKDKKKEEPGSFFQRQRVDLLLGELAKKFPPKFVAPTQPGPEVKGTCTLLF